MQRSAGRASSKYAMNASSENVAITVAIESADRPSNRTATKLLDTAPAII
jgi:hypothetical protein